MALNVKSNNLKATFRGVQFLKRICSCLQKSFNSSISNVASKSVSTLSDGRKDWEHISKNNQKLPLIKSRSSNCPCTRTDDVEIFPSCSFSNSYDFCFKQLKRECLHSQDECTRSSMVRRALSPPGVMKASNTSTATSNIYDVNVNASLTKKAPPLGYYIGTSSKHETQFQPGSGSVRSNKPACRYSTSCNYQEKSKFDKATLFNEKKDSLPLTINSSYVAMVNGIKDIFLQKKHFLSSGIYFGCTAVVNGIKDISGYLVTFLENQVNKCRNFAREIFQFTNNTESNVKPQQSDTKNEQKDVIRENEKCSSCSVASKTESVSKPQQPDSYSVLSKIESISKPQQSDNKSGQKNMTHENRQFTDYSIRGDAEPISKLQQSQNKTQQKDVIHKNQGYTSIADRSFRTISDIHRVSPKPRNFMRYKQPTADYFHKMLEPKPIYINTIALSGKNSPVKENAITNRMNVGIPIYNITLAKKNTPIKEKEVTDRIYDDLSLSKRVFLSQHAEIKEPSRFIARKGPCQGCGQLVCFCKVYLCNTSPLPCVICGEKECCCKFKPRNSGKKECTPACNVYDQIKPLKSSCDILGKTSVCENISSDDSSTSRRSCKETQCSLKTKHCESNSNLSKLEGQVKEYPRLCPCIVCGKMRCNCKLKCCDPAELYQRLRSAYKKKLHNHETKSCHLPQPPCHKCGKLVCCCDSSICKPCSYCGEEVCCCNIPRNLPRKCAFCGKRNCICKPKPCIPPEVSSCSGSNQSIKLLSYSDTCRPRNYIVRRCKPKPNVINQRASLGCVKLACGCSSRSSTSAQNKSRPCNKCGQLTCTCKRWCNHFKTIKE